MREGRRARRTAALVLAAMDAPPELQERSELRERSFGEPDAVAAESAEFVTRAVRRTNGSGGTIRCRWGTRNGSARAIFVAVLASRLVARSL